VSFSSRVTPVPAGDRRPRVVQSAVDVTVAHATAVVRVCGRRSPTGPHGHGQNGDFLGRPRLERRLAVGVAESVVGVAAVATEVDPAASRATRRHVDAASPAPPRRIGSRRLHGGCGPIAESSEKTEIRTFCNDIVAIAC